MKADLRMPMPALGCPVTWATPAAVDHLEIAFGDYNVTIATADATSPGTFAARLQTLNRMPTSSQL